MYIERALDLEKVLSKRSLFLVGPRKQENLLISRIS